ncbi:Transposon Ty3-I Gag-Pol polyprotein [Echinococcus granulosus]|uniref:Transposon Ty3-I Gag-Pol polyprotein n=1 Tax=Echinococcus granulosus TaxID=6210 RepID=W6UIB1_ECHGR|nr:Transposon Ty3-I Gag-Pol polyprotein [Echinococcus granulosus]EUB57842.1 Transposon Ty3-I Gag-Pol polyprotein [Echinococcus granulosus]
MNQPGSSKNARDREAETDESRFTLIAALADLPSFEEDMNFEEWLLTAKFNHPLYPRCQRIPLILRALPHDLFVAAVGAGITHDTDVDQCCDTLAQLAIDFEEQTLARDFFQRFQKAYEAEEEYARNLQLLAERAFRGCPPNKIANWVTVQFKHGIRPSILAEKLCEAKTNPLDQLVKLATKKRQELLGPLIFRKPQNWSNAASSYRGSPRHTPRPGEPSFSFSCLLPNGSYSYMRVPGKLEGRSCSFLLDSGAAKSIVNLQAFPTLCNRVKILPPSAKLRSAERREMLVEGETSLKVCIGKETWTVKFVVCPELAWNVVLGADFLRYTKAVLSFSEGTFPTHETTGVNTDTSPPKDDADDICNVLFKAAAISINNLDDLCTQLTHISNYERKELRQLLLKYANISSQGARLGRTNIVKHKIDTNEARLIWQPPRRIPPPLLEEVNRLVEEMLRDEVIKPSKSPWASPIALVKKNDGSLRLCIDYRKFNAVTKKDAFPLTHINDSLNSLHGSQ